jgi:hypothetical protein
MVGSIYTFCKAQGVAPVMLDENYRSGATLVEFARLAGYEPGLRSDSPELRLHLVEPLPTVQPEAGPAGLRWTPEWAELLDPARPAACFVYEEGRISQWNRFEADAVAALVFLLHGRIAYLHVCDLPGGTIGPSNLLGRYLRCILPAFAQMDRASRAERTGEASRDRRAQGLGLGHAAYGFKYAVRYRRLSSWPNETLPGAGAGP